MHCELVVPGLFGTARRNAAMRRAALESCSRAAEAAPHRAQRSKSGCSEDFDLGEGPFPAAR